MTALTHLPRAWALAAAAAVTGAAAVTLTLTAGSNAPSAPGAGEKVTGSGSSAGITGGGGSGTGNNGNGNGNGGSNGNNSPGKAFTISGSVEGLFPGATTKLFLTVTNPNNQAMTVTALSATLQSVTSPSGQCVASSGNLTILPYTGQAFDVPKNTSAASTGYIPLTLPSTVSDACQNATFTLSYSGKAVQK